MDNSTKSRKETVEVAIEVADAIKRILRHSWKSIDYTYARLTNQEQLLISQEQFADALKWVQS